MPASPAIDETARARFFGRWIAALGYIWAACTAPMAAQAQSAPDFSGLWARQGIEASTFEAPPSGPGPIMNLRKPNSRFDYLMVGDYANPILQPWVAEIIKKNGEEEVAGRPVLVPHNACWPEGVPSILNLREPVRLLQTPEQVTILYQRDHQVRRIFLNQEHPENLEPSWYGHSVGHYDGDVLIVDTVAIRVDPHTFSDGFGSPQSKKLHVVERYRVMDMGRALQVAATIEDPDVFTTPWVGLATYGRLRDDTKFMEIACPENNRHALGGEYPMPLATKFDF